MCQINIETGTTYLEKSENRPTAAVLPQMRIITLQREINFITFTD